MKSTAKQMWDSVAYYMRLAALTIWGPAQWDDEHDPVVALKRRYGRPIHPWRHADR